MFLLPFNFDKVIILHVVLTIHLQSQFQYDLSLFITILKLVDLKFSFLVPFDHNKIIFSKSEKVVWR